MGYRTVVMLSNDEAHRWAHDAKLGEKIAAAMNHVEAGANAAKAKLGNYGSVVECVHADTQTLAVLDGYTFLTPVAHKSWAAGETDADVQLRLLQAAAEKLGYRIVKKPAKKS